MNKLAVKFREMAERLDGEIAAKWGSRRENTPKRQREAAAQRIEGHHLQRVKDAMEKLAEASEQDVVPESLAGIKSKAQLLAMLRTRLDTSGGYYSIRDTGEFCDNSPAAVALREWLSGRRTEAELARDAEAARLSKIRDLEAMVKFSTIPGFFPTPPAVIEAMLDKAAIEPGQRVLEPSAGKGDIADALTAAGIADVVCCEISSTLCDILAAKGHQVVHGDFLERFSVLDPKDGAGEVTDAMRQFDRVVMNPPFERGQDIDHVRHAYKLLKPGGRLVSVISVGAFNRSDRKAADFRDWFEGIAGESEPLPDGSFKDAFRSTGVSAVLVVLDKAPEAKPVLRQAAGYVKRNGQALLGFMQKQLTLALL